MASSEEEIQELRDRVEALESALDALNPGWRYGVHQISCECAYCVTG